MIDFAGQTVTILGRLAALPNRVAAVAIGHRGGVARRALAQQTTLVAIGRQAAPQLADGRLQAKLGRADQIGAPCLSENALLRALDLLPPAAPVAAAVRLDDLGDKAGLDSDLVRLLVLFDVIQPDEDGALGFRDLTAAREVGRLLADGLGLAAIVQGTADASGGRFATDDHPLARLKLVCDDSGRLARRIEGRLAELDGQLRLPLANPGNPSVDEVFEAAEDAEQAGDLAAAEALYRLCVGLDRSDPIAPFNLANVLRERGRTSEAKSYLQLALAVDPKFADAWYNLALLLDAEGRKDLARAYYERASAVDPDYADPLFKLAKLHFDAGDLAKASRLWRRYLILDPDSEWSRRARNGLMLCRSDSGQEAG
jgi:tetratricopeptide (TPR) repeat protein